MRTRLAVRAALVAVLLAVGTAAAPAVAGEIQVAWDAVANASGYRVYYGTSSGNYTQTLTSTTTTATINNLNDCQTWYVAVKAYNSAGESTQFSNELSGWPRPAVSSATPGAVQQGQQVVVNISGSNFQSGATVEIDNPRVTLTSVRVNSCNQVQLLATVEPTAPNASAARVGSFALSVVNPDTVFGSRSDTFQVAVNPARFDINTSDATTQGRIDGKDTVWLARLFGSQEGTPTFDPDSDFDGDGWIDGNDLAYIASNLGRCWSGTAWSTAACPEGLR